MPQPDRASEQADLAAAEAAAIGGKPSSEDPRAERSEEALVEHASHGDQHAARRVIEDATSERDDARAAQQGDPDYERSSEREEDKP